MTGRVDWLAHPSRRNVLNQSAERLKRTWIAIEDVRRQVAVSHEMVAEAEALLATLRRPGARLRVESRRALMRDAAGGIADGDVTAAASGYS